HPDQQAVSAVVGLEPAVALALREAALEGGQRDHHGGGQGHEGDHGRTPGGSVRAAVFIVQRWCRTTGRRSSSSSATAAASASHELGGAASSSTCCPMRFPSALSPRRAPLDRQK